MLNSSTKQTKFLSSENMRIKRKYEQIKAKTQKKPQKSHINCSRKRIEDKSLNQISDRNKNDNMYGLNELGRTYEENTSPTFRNNLVSNSRNKVSYILFVFEVNNFD